MVKIITFPINLALLWGNVGHPQFSDTQKGSSLQHLQPASAMAVLCWKFTSLAA